MTLGLRTHLAYFLISIILLLYIAALVIMQDFGDEKKHLNWPHWILFVQGLSWVILV